MEYSISNDSDNFEMEACYHECSINGYSLCRGCGKEILDRYYLKVNETSWHEECLKCTYCSVSLFSEETCFIKSNKIMCKIDYYKHFGIKCAKCSRNIQTSDWVRRAKDNVYHLACFACESCKRQLSTGEEFALQNNKVLCKTHYCESIDGENSENSKAKNKRVRTTFTEEQLQILQANFEVDSNPDGQDLERIAQVTGLSKRVTQVWFQNSRARQKKYKEKKIDANSTLDMNEASNDEQTWNQNELTITSNSNCKKRLLSTASSFQNDFNDFSLIKNQTKYSNSQPNRNKENSWSSNDSFSEDGHDNSIYDSSLELNNEID